jgi:predicted acylesterase/phospholipase RssA
MGGCETRFLLTCDGGGIRGLATVQMLKAFAAELDFSNLDFMAGTSTGAIVSLMLARPGHRPTESVLTLENLYLHRMRTMFHGGRDGRYDRDLLLEFFLGEFGDLRLGEAICPVGVVAFDLVGGRPVLLSSVSMPDLSFVQALCCTTAVQDVVPPVAVGRMLLADGGVAANNPVLLAYATARSLYPQACGFDCLSLATAWEPHVIRNGTTPSAELQYATAQMCISDLVAGTLPGFRYRRIHSFTQERQIRMDDASPAALKALETAGKTAVREHGNLIKEFVQGVCRHTP